MATAFYLPPAGGGEEGGQCKALPKCAPIRVEILQHFMIPKPQHPYTVRLEVARALRIAGALWRGVVLASIELNRQSHCGAIEIQHEACDRVLLAKAKTVELFATEALPQALLCVGQVLAQVSCGLQEGRWDGGWEPRGTFPPSQPPPAGGRCQKPRFLRVSWRFDEICDGVTPVPPATLWRPGDRPCQSPR